MVQLLEIIDKVLMAVTVLALIWFLAFSSHRRYSTITIAILYLIGAPFDLIYGRTASFWMSVILSFMYLYLYKDSKPKKV